MRRVAVLLLAATGLAIAWPQMPIASAVPQTVTSGISSWSANRGARAPIRFNMVAASWTDSTTNVIEYRTSLDGSSWTEWKDLDIEGGEQADDNQPEAKTQKPGRFTSLAWVGDARFIQTKGFPAGKLHLVNVNGDADDPGPSVRAARSFKQWLGGSAQAYAAGAGPIGIYTRAQWGASESLREQTPPTYAKNAVLSVIHHTDTGNNYSASEVPKILRGIYAYHVKNRGFRDIAYNFLVDRYGRIWEGRWGGMTKAVSGAHTAGFNYATIGVSMLGTFTAAGVPTAMRSAIARVLSWKFTVHLIRPRATVRYTVTSSTAGGMRWKPGTVVGLNTIVSHRDVNQTACPGTQGYKILNWLRYNTWVKLPPSGAYVSDLKTIWKLTTRGRLAVPAASVWQSNLPYAEIKRLTPEEMSWYPNHGWAPFRDGTLVRGIRPPDPAPSPSPSVDPSASPGESPTATPSPVAVTYFVSGGLLRPFQSEADVATMGFKLSRVIDVAGDVLAKYRLGAPVDPVVYPDGMLLRSPAASVPYVVRGGKRWAVLPQVFPSYAYTTDDVVSISADVMSSIPFGGHLLFRDGTLIQGSSTNRTIYVISEGRRRPISSSFVFSLMGYKSSNIRVVSETIVNLHPLGAILDGRGP